MTNSELNDAQDIDTNDVVVESTPVELSVESVEDVAPAVEETVKEPVKVEEPVAEPEVITSPEPVEEKPALTPVGDGVIGSGKVKKKTAEKVEAVKSDVEKVAVYANRNLVWAGVGKITKGYNIVTKDEAAKWLTIAGVKEVSPEVIKSNLG